MNKQTNLEKSYLSVVEFLMQAKQHVFELGAEHSLSGMQVITLLMLEKPHQMSYLKQTFNCDPSNITGIIDALEQKRLATRFENANDRRTKMVKLLPKGRQLRTALLVKLTAPDNFLLGKLNQSEMASFIPLVQKIIQP